MCVHLHWYTHLHWLKLQFCLKTYALRQDLNQQVHGEGMLSAAFPCSMPGACPQCTRLPNFALLFPLVRPAAAWAICCPASGAAGAGPAARRSWSPPPSASGQPPRSQQTGTVCFCCFALDSVNDLGFFMTEYLCAPVTGSNVWFQTSENSHYQVTRVWKELALLGGGKSKRGNIIPPAIALTALQSI